MRQSHLFENGKSRTDMLPARTRHVARDRSGRSTVTTRDKLGPLPLGTAGNRPIQRVKRFSRISRRSASMASSSVR